MGAVRMRVQTADKNITIIHTTPVHQLTSWEEISCMFVRNKSIIKTFLTSNCCFWLKYIALSTEKVIWSDLGEKYKIKIKLRWALFVTYTTIQSITSSEMCSLHLTHPSAHTPGAVDTHTHTHTPGAVGSSGSSWGFGALLKGLTSVVDNSSRSQDSNPQPQITSPTLYPLGHNCPTIDKNICGWI